jgi:hypothetical protein
VPLPANVSPSAVTPAPQLDQTCISALGASPNLGQASGACQTSPPRSGMMCSSCAACRASRGRLETLPFQPMVSCY